MVSIKQQQQFDQKLSGLFMIIAYYDMILKMMASVKFVLPYDTHPIVSVYAQSIDNQTLKSLLNKKTNTLIGKWMQKKNSDPTIIVKNIEECIAKANEKISAIVKKRNLT